MFRDDEASRRITKEDAELLSGTPEPLTVLVPVEIEEETYGPGHDFRTVSPEGVVVCANCHICTCHFVNRSKEPCSKADGDIS